MKLPPITYTFHRNYENCALKAWCYNVVPKGHPDKVPFEKSEATEWGNKVHDALAARINRGTPLLPAIEHYERFCSFPAGYKVVAELKVAMRSDGSGCGYWDDDCIARGNIDVAIEGAPLSKAAAITDWKTGGNKRYTDEGEIALHALLLKANRRHLEKITGWYVWLKDGEIGKPYDLSDFAGTWRKASAIRAEMVEKLKFGREGFEPTENPLCGWCNVFTCKFNPRRGT